MKPKNRNNKGTAAIEFAIVMPLLFVLIFGVIDFSLLMYDKQVITNASREGARAGIVLYKDDDGNISRLSQGDITTIVNSYCSNYLITFASTTEVPTTTVTNTGTSFGDDLVVTVQYTYTFLIIDALLDLFFEGTMSDIQDLNAVTVMRYE